MKLANGLSLSVSVTEDYTSVILFIQYRDEVDEAIEQHPQHRCSDHTLSRLS